MVKFGVIRICSFKEILDAGRAALIGGGEVDVRWACDSARKLSR